MAYVDFKITIWERVFIDDESVDEIAKKIKDGTINSSDDLINEFESITFDSDVMYETAEQITLEENDNQSTIELYNSEGETICTNEK
jgi:hypothetical protein